jgi:hypothetical protein
LYTKIIFGRSHYQGGKKYRRRFDVYFYHNDIFCPCCGMAFRASPNNKKNKDKVNAFQRGRNA